MALQTCGRAASTSPSSLIIVAVHDPHRRHAADARRTSRNIILQNSYILILAIGMVIVIVGGHIDLSVGSVAAFAGRGVRAFVISRRPCRGGSASSRPRRRRAGRRWQGFWVAFVGIPAFIVDPGGHAPLPRRSPTVVLENISLSPFPDGVLAGSRAGFSERACSAATGTTSSPPRRRLAVVGSGSAWSQLAGPCGAAEVRAGRRLDRRLRRQDRPDAAPSSCGSPGSSRTTTASRSS